VLGRYLNHVFRATEDENRRAILRAMPRQPGAQLLDLGCGDGAWTMEVARHIGAGSVLGVEFVEAFAEVARQSGVEAVVADLGGRLPYEDASIDVIHSNQVIEHLPGTDNFLGEIARLLAPGGYAVVSTNNLSSWHNVISLSLGWQPTPCHVSDEAILGNPATFNEGAEAPTPGQTHLRVFTGRALAELAAHHGLTVDYRGAAGYYPFPATVARALARVDPVHGAFLVQRYRPRSALS
jgi:SAM-dependent methyltransferase